MSIMFKIVLVASCIVIQAQTRSIHSPNHRIVANETPLETITLWLNLFKYEGNYLLANLWDDYTRAVTPAEKELAKQKYDKEVYEWPQDIDAVTDKYLTRAVFCNYSGDMIGHALIEFSNILRQMAKQFTISGRNGSIFITKAKYMDELYNHCK